MDKLTVRSVLLIIALIGLTGQNAIGQSAKPAAQSEWDKTVELAKKEGKVVVSIPTSAELRK